MVVFLTVNPKAAAQTAAAPNSKETRRQEAQDGKKLENGLVQKLTRLFFTQKKTRLFGHVHTLNVVRFAYYDRYAGISLGLDATLNDPTRYHINLRLIASLRGAHNHRFLFAYPRVSGSRFGLFFRAEWLRDLRRRYYGLGNTSVNDRSLTDKKSDTYIDDTYYLYNFKRPRLTVWSSYLLSRQWSIWFGYGLQWVEPQLKKEPERSFLAQDRPFGYLGGSGNHFTFRLSWDTRDHRLYATRGFLTEFAFEPNFASVVVPVGPSKRTRRDVTYYRYLFSDAHFLPLLGPRLVLANRVVFEAITGDAPFYAFGELADRVYSHVLGGSHSLRGYEDQRFQDKVKFLTLTELRYRFYQLAFAGQAFDLIVVGFFDTGRVWPSVSEIRFRGFHTTFGAGLWLRWNRNTVMRADLGRSPEQWKANFRFEASF